MLRYIGGFMLTLLFTFLLICMAIPFCFRLLSNAFSDFGSIGRKKQK